MHRIGKNRQLGQREKPADKNLPDRAQNARKRHQPGSFIVVGGQLVAERIPGHTEKAQHHVIQQRGGDEPGQIAGRRQTTRTQPQGGKEQPGKDCPQKNERTPPTPARGQAVGQVPHERVGERIHQAPEGQHGAHVAGVDPQGDVINRQGKLLGRLLAHHDRNITQAVAELGFQTEAQVGCSVCWRRVSI